MSCGTVQLWCTIAAHNCPIDAVRQGWEVPGAKHASGLRTAREPTSLPPSVTPLGYLSPTSADGYSVWRRVLSPARPGRQRVGGVPGYFRHNSSRYHTATELHPKSYDWRTGSSHGQGGPPSCFQRFEAQQQHLIYIYICVCVCTPLDAVAGQLDYRLAHRTRTPRPRPRYQQSFNMACSMATGRLYFRLPAV